MLDIRHLSKRFGGFEAVTDVSISVPDGAFLVTGRLAPPA